MKKNAFVFTALLLLAGAFSAHAQQTTSAPRYLMLVVEEANSMLGGISNATITIIQPDGTFSTEEFSINLDAFDKAIEASISTKAVVNVPDTNTRRQRYARNLFYQVQARRINELSAQGWTLANTTQDDNAVRYWFQRSTR